MLREKSFSIHEIAIILEKTYAEIILYIKGWNYFKEDSFHLSLHELEERIHKIERKKFNLISFFLRIINKFVTILVNTYKKIKSGILFSYTSVISISYYIYSFFCKAINYVLKKISTIIVFLAEKFWLFLVMIASVLMFFVIKIASIPFKKYYSDAKTKFFAKNFLKITKSNNNIIFQIINYNRDQNELVEDYSAASMKETKDIFTQLFSSDKEYLNSDKLLSLFFAFNEKIQTIRNEERKKRYLSILATFAAFYVFYNVSIKSGILIFTILGTSITVGAIDIHNNIDEKSYGGTGVDTTLSIIEPIQLDSINIIDSIQKTLIQKAIPVFEKVLRCPNLTELGYKQLEYINSDNKNYFEENYYKFYTDERLYVQVAVYQNIKYASFQRLNLLNKGFKNSKIIRFRKKGLVYYSVSINDYNIEEYGKVCSEIEKWNSSCYAEKSMARVLYNY